jgi:dGTPase
VGAATQAAIDRHAPASADEVRALPPLVQFSGEMGAASHQLKQFLFKNLYRHPQVMQTNTQARRMVCELFAAYRQDPRQMPPDFAAQADAPRAVADYIAGMTDRFAAKEHERLTGQRLLTVSA